MRRLCLALSLSLACVPAAAQDAAPDARQGENWGGSEIVVTGRNLKELSEPVVTRQARLVSRETDLRHTPLATFSDYACPGVMGIKREFAEALVGRIRLIAEELGVPLHQAGNCQPNILIVFTEDGRADLAAINRRTKELSRSLSAAERKELLSHPGPAYVFTITEDRMRNGQRIPRRQNLVQVPVGTQEGGQSLISNGIRRDITSATVLFDFERVKDFSLIQLADYAAMRIFARTRDAQGEGAPDSILALFDPANDAPPPGLTAFDRAFLTTLYEAPPYTSGQGNLQRVASTLRKQVGAQE